MTISFFELLEDAAGSAVEVPHGSRDIRADGALCAYVGRRLNLPADFIHEVFGPVGSIEAVPVRAVHGIVSWVEGDPEPFERVRMLEAWAFKKGRTVNPEAHRAAIEEIIPGSRYAEVGVAS